MATAADSQGGDESAPSQNNSDNGTFECNICLDTARDAVVSMCGHLFWYVIFISVIFCLFSV